MSVDVQQVMTVAEAADILGITPGHVRLLIHRGQLEAGRFGRDRTVSLAAIDAYLARCASQLVPADE